MIKLIYTLYNAMYFHQVYTSNCTWCLLQKLMDDAETCRRKMNAAAALIEGLGGEKIRWTEQSQEFKSQIGR